MSQAIGVTSKPRGRRSSTRGSTKPAPSHGAWEDAEDSRRQRMFWGLALRARAEPGKVSALHTLPKSRLHPKGPDARASGFSGIVCSLARIAIGWSLVPVIIDLFARLQIRDAREHGRRGIPALGAKVGAHTEGVPTRLLAPWDPILRGRAFEVLRTERFATPPSSPHPMTPSASTHVNPTKNRITTSSSGAARHEVRSSRCIRRARRRGRLLQGNPLSSRAGFAVGDGTGAACAS